MIGLIGLLILKVNIYLNSYNHIKELDSIFYDGDTNVTKYIGFIEIKRLGIKRGIVNGINDIVLNANDIGLIKNDNIILAGHSVENVFGKLHSIKFKDEIILYLDNKITKYYVTDIKVVDKKDVDSLNSELNLITCMYDNNKRLIIGAKKSI